MTKTPSEGRNVPGNTHEPKWSQRLLLASVNGSMRKPVLSKEAE